MVEYVLLACLIAGVGLIGISNIGLNISNIFNDINNALLLDEHGQSPEPPTDWSKPAYAMLYDDGSLIFQRGDEPAPNKTLIANYTDFENVSFYSPAMVPWDSQRLSIYSIFFKDEIKPFDCSYWFYQMKNCLSIDSKKLNTVNVTNMENMFSECSSLEILDTTHYNTVSVYSMKSLFVGCVNLKQLDLSSFDTSNVEIMDLMFSGCSSLETLDLSNFDTSKTRNVLSMFAGCTSLKNINVNKWDVSKMSMMNSMFSYCESLITLDLSTWNFANVSHMPYMFQGCTNLEQITFPENINESKAVTIIGGNTLDQGICNMFYRCYKLKETNNVPSWYVGNLAGI